MTAPARVAALLAAAMIAPIGAVAQSCADPCVGPPRGAVIAAGGGVLSPRVYEEFVTLAGGEDARIVLIPTAGSEDGSHDGWAAIEALKRAGVERIEILHTRHRAVADLAAFSSPLESATGVWLSGGKQWRLMDAYLETHTHEALARLLARGGVIGGNSAGASALASFLLRGGQSNADVVTENHETGFGFLRNTAIDQHLLARGRENEMFGVLRKNPHLLGIGLTEGSALVVTADLARVIGGRVAIYDVTDPLMLIPLRWLDPGEAYDLGIRRTVLADHPSPDGGNGR